MRLCVATYFDKGFGLIGEICAVTLKGYAALHGFELTIDRTLQSDRPPAWNKILLIQRLLREGYDFVLWVDADALFLRFEPDIRAEIVSGKDLFMVKHEIRSQIQPGAWLTLDVPNTGVMLLRNSDWTHRFLQDVWDRSDFIHHRFWENAAVLDLMGYRALIGSAKRNEPDANVLAHISWLDVAWNSIPGRCASPQPIIHHYADVIDRLPYMRADLARAERALREGA
jgi:hypothetical protein